jgi:2-polyprenyl-6-methoxyphenol hydroxylase-like FAD-dependent oxidoreductase
MAEKRGGHAVVVGASLAGLLAARVLADRFRLVTVIERDVLPEGPESRKGVPQGRHAHALLVSGERVVRALFPGLIEELVEGGAVRVNALADGRWWQCGGYRVQHGSDMESTCLSRVFFEDTIRRRVRSIANVTIRSGAVRELVTDNGRIVGVESDAGAETTVIAADLVVDASGRGSHAVRWLERLGYPTPPVSQVHIDVGYASRLLRRTPGQLPDRRWFLTAATPPAKRTGIALPIEGDRWLVTLAGLHGDHATPDDEGLMAYAQSLPTPEIADLLRVAEPLSPIRTHRLRSSQWRHFERLRRTPAAFVAIGDAICTFNPVYGQGMSSAALQAMALGKVIDKLGATSPDMPRCFYRAAKKVLANPWQIAVGADFIFPETSGPKPPLTDAINRYVTRVIVAAQRDEAAARALLDVQNLLAPPASLMRPGIVLRSLRVPRQHPTVSSPIAITP